jgi:hypothetical protein
MTTYENLTLSERKKIRDSIMNIVWHFKTKKSIILEECDNEELNKCIKGIIQVLNDSI